MSPSLLDTDILSEVLKQRNDNVVANAAAYLQQHREFAISEFTRFEIRHGYLEAHATRLLPRFDQFCTHSIILPIAANVLDRAAELWVAARRGGYPHGDADLIIAATAVETDRTLVSGNTSHFEWIPNLRLANWRDD